MSLSPSPIDLPEARLRVPWDRPLRSKGDYVLYWMTANRRSSWNFALDRAVDHARALGKPLVVLEALRCDYPWASDRMHAFVLRGMGDQAQAFGEQGIHYYPYVEPTQGAGKGLLQALAARACVVVADDCPSFFFPKMLASARLDVESRFEAVDSNGMLPLRACAKRFSRAYDFRRFLQRELPQHLMHWPRAQPNLQPALAQLKGLPEDLLKRWPKTALEDLGCEPAQLAQWPIDHGVPPAPLFGGARAAEQQLDRFMGSAWASYGDTRNQLAPDATSGFSAYLHFGQLSSHQIFARIVEAEDWSPEQLSEVSNGKREGWWGMGPSAEAFLDQLITWRELGLNAAIHDPAYRSLESIPNWAQESLRLHAGDARPSLYSLEQFDQGETHDELWNAAQNQLRIEGRMPGYLRMLWGKKILHWSESPQEAHRIMLELNNRYALDGRDPNSHSGILWVLGKFDRAWGPERPVFGKLRYMTSESARRKLRPKDYIERWSGAGLNFS